uniref:Uncharacterized protein n=1 Tax=Tanacetum cinerariifolium TaxID=118510 RepID=A0A6L2K1K1_TANCI|nr:hypothetical protein [Tanacetum cinerariifolium]
MLKQGDYEIWRLRIEQYFQVQDYALWDVIENGNSIVPVTQTTTAEGGAITTTISSPITTEEKIKKKNDVKEYLNLKFLRSLPSEWNNHVVVWSNKPDLDTMSIDDLYNNFKIFEQKVKGTASSNSSSQNMAFVSSLSTNEVHTAYGVSNASTQSSTASTQKTGNKITINGSDTTGFDKSNVECYNCHKMGHFARECRGPRNQDSRNRYPDSSRRTMHVEETPPKAMVSIDRVGFDWSYMVEDEVPTNTALMAFSDYETDLSYSSLEEFKQPEFESYGPKSCEIESKNASEDIPNELKEYHVAPLVKDKVSDNKDCSVESPVVVEKKTVVPTIAKVEVVRPKQQEKLVRKTVRAEMYRPKAVNTARPKAVNTARPSPAVVNAVRENQVNVVKAFACWVWRPTKPNGASITLKRHNYIDVRGRSKEFSVARTPQKNSVAERRNRTLIEAARTILADSKLPITFWAEAVNTACYVQNKALVVTPYNKTPYELFRGRSPALSFMRPFGCHVTILNTLDHLGKFDRKADEEENLHIKFLENKPIVGGAGLEWLFDIDMLTKLMNYVPVVAGTKSNDFADGSPLFDSSPKISDDAGSPSSGDARKKHDEVSDKDNGASNELNSAFENLNIVYLDDPKMPGLETIETYDDFEEEDDFTKLESLIHVSPTPTTRIHKNHPLKQVIGSLNTLVQTRRKLKPTNEQGFISGVYEGKTHEDLNTCLFACFLLQIEPTRVAKSLSNPAWVEAMQEELLQLNYKRFEFWWIGLRIDVKSDFLYERIEDEVYVCQPLGFEDPDHPNKKGDGIFINQDKYVAEVLRKFNFLDVKSVSTPVDMEKTLVKDADDDDVDVHLYRSMTRSLMYLTTSRPDIIDYAGASLDRKFTTMGCQFLGGRLIPWQYKKQTMVAISTTKVEYMATASCYGQTATVRTVDNGEQEITATVDGKEFTVTEASVRRHL